MNVVKITFAALMISASTMGNAQNTETKEAKRAETVKKTADQRVATRMEVLNAKLGLSEAQANTVKTAMLEREKMRDELRTKFGTDKKAIQENMKASNKKCREVMMSTFTEEQKGKFKEMQKEQKANKGAKKEGKGKKVEKTEADELEESEM